MMSNICFSPDEAAKRMARRHTNKISWTFPDFSVEWEYTTQTRNYDGSFGTPQDKPVLMQTVWRSGSSPKYSVFYGYKKEVA